MTAMTHWTKQTPEIRHSPPTYDETQWSMKYMKSTEQRNLWEVV